MLDALAEAEDLRASEAEINHVVVRRARQAGLSPELSYSEIVRSGAGDMVAAKVRRAKALAVLMERITIDGNALAIGELYDDDAVAPKMGSSPHGAGRSRA